MARAAGLSFCYGAFVTLYRRRGASGAWERWGVACDQCHVALHEPPG